VEKYRLQMNIYTMKTATHYPCVKEIEEMQNALKS